MPVIVNTRRLDTIISSLKGRADGVLLEIAEDVADEVERVILEMGVYDSGDTYRSVDYGLEGSLRGRVSVKAKSPQGFPYPVAVHEGYVTPTGRHIAGRPFMRVAVERVRRRSLAKWSKLFR